MPKTQTVLKLKQGYRKLLLNTKSNKKKHRKPSIRCVAKDFNIPRKTLEDRLKGAVPRNQAQEALMNLTINEEKELVHWITTLTRCGYAPRYCTVRELAEILRNR